MDCPKCNDVMGRRTVQKVEVDECAKCNGIWFDDDELRKVKDRTDPDLRWMDFELWKHEDEFDISGASLECPKCEAKMATIGYGETAVEIEYCAQCKGIWLDGGELQKIIESLTNELETKSAREYVRASLEEALEILVGPESLISEWRDFLTVMTLLEYRVLSENPKLHDWLVSFQQKSHGTMG